MKVRDMSIHLKTKNTNAGRVLSINAIRELECARSNVGRINGI
jgi:hypothetical protein